MDNDTDDNHNEGSEDVDNWTDDNCVKTVNCEDVDSDTDDD